MIEKNSAVSVQDRVQPWMMACFGAMIAGDREERNHRFIEEALELVQSTGCSASEAHQLVDYVYARPVGEPPQEVGGVMVTLAALCLANELDMHDAAEIELARIWTKVEVIRAKQAAKPKHSALPEAAPQQHAQAVPVISQQGAGDAVGQQAGELPPLPEMDSLADVPHAINTPEDWDSDYRSTWQKLQVAERNKMQWRAYALELRAALAQRPTSAAPDHLRIEIAASHALLSKHCVADLKGGKPANLVERIAELWSWYEPHAQGAADSADAAAVEGGA